MHFRKTLQSSEVLVLKLSDEYANWKMQLQGINKRIEHMDLDAFLIAFSITHLSHLTFETRQYVLSVNFVQNEFRKINFHFYFQFYNAEHL